MLCGAPGHAGTEGSYFSVIVSDIEKSAAWYRRVLGLEEKTRLDGGGQFQIVNLHGPGLFVELIATDSALDRPEGRIEGPFKVGLLVPDLDHFLTRLPESMQRPELVTDTRNALRLVQILDPDGNTVQVMQAIAETPDLPDPLEAGWKGEAVCEALHQSAAQRILRCSFPPSVGHERHYHSPHFGYALAGGRMRITDARGTREVDLATGSSFSSDGVAWHEVVNVGDSTVVYLIVEPR